MKTIYSSPLLSRLCLTVLALMLCVMTAAAGSETVRRVYDVSKLKFDVTTEADGNSYTRVNWEGLETAGEPGQPALPVEYIRFLVPVYVKVTDVKVMTIADGNKLTAPIIPVQTPVLANSTEPEEFTAPDAEAYGHSYELRAESVEDGFIDGCNHIITVAVHPFAYDPINGVYHAASNMVVTLKYEECDAADMKSTPLFPPHQSKYLDLSSLVVNPERATDPSFAPRKKPSASTPEYYYIITSRKLAPAFADLATWKRQKGYTVVVKSIEDIYEDDLYRIGATHYIKDDEGNNKPEEILDSAMSLRCFLQDQYQLRGHFFCLLGGDWRTPMPIRKGWKRLEKIENNSYIDNGENCVSTDNYFSDLTYNYKLKSRLNLNILTYDIVIETEIGSMTDTLSYKPEISIGRLLCSEEREIENYIRKLEIYEADPGFGDNDYLSLALAFFQGERTALGTNWFKRFYTNYVNYLQELFLTIFDNITEMKDYKFENLDDVGPSGKDVVSQIDKVGFSSWHAHGNPAGIACSVGTNFVTSTDDIFDVIPREDFINESGNGLDCLTNKNKPGVVYSISCENTPFDYLASQAGHAFNMRYNLGEAYTSAFNTGGVAFIGNTRGSYSPNSLVTQFNFFTELLKGRKIGTALAYAKSMEWKDSTSIHDNTTISLIGEPEFEMWLGKPAIMNLTVNPSYSGFKIEGTAPDSLQMVATNGKQCKFWGATNIAPSMANPFGSGEYCLSLWNTGYLPLISLYGQDGTLLESKKYIVRNAVLGNTDSSWTTTYTVGQNGELSVKALNRVDTYSGFKVDNSGKVVIECEGEVFLNGGEVLKGGTLDIRAKNVRMGKGFKVHPGGIFKIQNR